MSTIAPLALLSAVTHLGSSSEGWSLQEGEGTRSFSQHVVFEHAFSATPVVQLGIVSLDASKDHNLRLRTRVQDISSTGFTLVVETWLHSQLWAVDISWLAIGT
jgi:hypothetical protein